MRRLLVACLLLATAAFASGCLRASLGPDEQGPMPPAPNVTAHSVGGPAGVPASFADLSIRLLPVGVVGAEPTIGVTSDGAIFVTGGGARVHKSTDGGATWTDVSDRRTAPAAGLPMPASRADFDPYLWVDPLTDRVYSAPLYVACTDLRWSDDGGATWEQNQRAGCGIPGHDHQSLVTGPPPTGVATDGYPNVLYYTYNSFRADGTWVGRSRDGGRTWDLGQRIIEPDCQDGINGAPAVAPDGTVYVPKPGCVGMRIAVSKDAGLTWTLHDVDGAGIGGGDNAQPVATPVGPVVVGVPFETPYAGNPGATVDAAGNAYVAYAGGDGRLYVTRSLDGGDSWAEPVAASAPEVTATAFSAAIAGADGHLAVAYFGTTADTSGWTSKEAHYAPPDTVWHLYLTFTSGATAADPTFVSVRATPDDDPVQVGCIWQSGGANDCRNLADFFDITQRDGRAYLAYSDGCRRCSSAGDSRSNDLFVAVVDTGQGLYGNPLAPYRG